MNLFLITLMDMLDRYVLPHSFTAYLQNLWKIWTRNRLINQPRNKAADSHACTQLITKTENKGSISSCDNHLTVAHFSFSGEQALLYIIYKCTCSKCCQIHVYLS